MTVLRSRIMSLWVSGSCNCALVVFTLTNCLFIALPNKHTKIREKQLTDFPSAQFPFPSEWETQNPQKTQKTLLNASVWFVSTSVETWVSKVVLSYKLDPLHYDLLQAQDNIATKLNFKTIKLGACLVHV